MMPREKRKPNKDLTDMGMEEAIARLLQTDKEELADEIDRIKQDDEGVQEYVEERRSSIAKGARRTGKRFRL